MTAADQHARNASVFLDLVRLDSEHLENYLLAAAEFEQASACCSDEIVCATSDFEKHNLAELSSYFAYEAKRASGIYWYETHKIAEAVASFVEAEQHLQNCLHSIEEALKCDMEVTDLQRLTRRRHRTILCREIDKQWLYTCEARKAFSNQEWQLCLELYESVIALCRRLISDCRDFDDSTITSAVEANHFVTLLNLCQVKIGEVQSRAEQTVEGLLLSQEEAIEIARNWLDAYRYAINAVTAHPGVQRFYSGLVRIRSQLEKVAEDFPWEFLLTNFGNEADLVALLRAINSEQLLAVANQLGLAIEPRSACRVLFLAANPCSDSEPLQIDREAGELLYVLRRERSDVNIDITFRWATKPTELQQSVLACRPHVVHFSGHGTTSGHIVMEDFCGRPFVVSAEGLSNLFRCLDGEVRVVLLNSCHSAVQANGIAEHVDCVIGMSDAIGDFEARRFAVAFYRALSYAKSVATAFDLGCNELLLHGTGQQNLPKLTTRKDVEPHKLFLTGETSAQ